MNKYKREKIKQKEDNKEKHLEATMDEQRLLDKAAMNTIKACK
ncbi:hypothetical protein LCGC14_0396360 [marine sediment metagenome]|uniref:Uncharacterized protein n=1 Tax=marine sediment metagenome TaxID=412755 RepID=A0A0F9T3W2_9ZZZZ